MKGDDMNPNANIRTMDAPPLDKPWKFGSIVSTAVAMSAAVAHLMELPAKMKYERELYVRLHRTLYPTYGKIAGFEIGRARLTPKRP
ncbi:MAG: hypothetical protein IT168_24105 [Bryobacterales bacterium]|nr:hypothetical protein [Bryobacterales bacterium]